MTNILILSFINSSEKFAYTSLEALCADFEYDKLKVSKSRLGSVIRENGFYKNNFVCVEKITAYTKTEVLNRKSTEK